jgi:hypothetical protein
MTTNVTMTTPPGLKVVEGSTADMVTRYDPRHIEELLCHSCPVISKSAERRLKIQKGGQDAQL